MFNPHQSRTADGVLIEPGLIVFTNEMEAGRVVEDRTYGCCNEPGHTAAQTVVGGVWYTDHEAAAKGQCHGSCRHDHWFTVETKTHRANMNGERLSTTFHTYGGKVLYATDEFAKEA